MHSIQQSMNIAFLMTCLLFLSSGVLSDDNVQHRIHVSLDLGIDLGSKPSEQAEHKDVNQLAQDGGWSAWSPRRSCDSVPCGGPSKTTRVCNNPLPKRGGKRCLMSDGVTRGDVETDSIDCKELACLDHVESSDGVSRDLQCNDGYGIRILEAMYGKEGCNMNDVKSKISNDCDEKPTCRIMANHTVYGNPCPSQTQTLGVTYSCTKLIGSGSDRVQIKKGEQKFLGCDSDSAIHIIQALYIVYGDNGNACEQTNDTSVIPPYCNGNVQCALTNNHESFAPGGPCSNDYHQTSSLFIIYTCRTKLPLHVPCLKRWLDCGETNSAQPRIVNGTDAAIGAYPWMVRLFALTPTDGSNECGGSVISDRLILTAAHCFDGIFSDRTLWTVIAGDYALQSEPGEQITQVQAIVIHDHYNNSTYENDIALLVVHPPLTFTSNIKPVCLPSASMAVYPGQDCWLTGWGRTDMPCEDKLGSSQCAFNLQVFPNACTTPLIAPNCQKSCGLCSDDPPVYPTVLQQKRIRVLRDSVCQDVYGIDFYPNITICAGYNSTWGGQGGMCSGDSGGPFVCKTGYRWFKQGIASWSYCGEPNYPDVYTEVSQFADWLNNTMSSHTYCNNPLNVPDIPVG